MKRIWIGIGTLATLALFYALFVAPPQGAREDMSDPRARQTPFGDPVGMRDARDGEPPASAHVRLNERIAETALAVDDVRGAWGVAFPDGDAHTALVGIHIETSELGRAHDSVERDVAYQVARLQEVNRVAVTSDPIITSQIRQMSRGIAEGDAPDEHREEFEDLTKYLEPRAWQF